MDKDALTTHDYNAGDEVGWRDSEGTWRFGVICVIAPDRKWAEVRAHSTHKMFWIEMGLLQRVERSHDLPPPPAFLVFAPEEVRHVRWLLGVVDKVPLSVAERAVWNHVDATVRDWEKRHEQSHS